MEVLHTGHEVKVKLFDPVQFNASKENEKPQNAAPAGGSYNKSAPAVSNGSTFSFNARPQNQSSRNAQANSSMNQSLSEHLTHPINSLSPYQNK
jgi:hypothetical protein